MWKTVGVLLICSWVSLDVSVAEEGPFFASGIKVGEATHDSAIIWVRLTRNSEADFARLPILSEGLPVNQNPKIEMPTDIVPGMEGQARVRYWSGDPPESNSRVTDWVAIDKASDFIHQFRLDSLKSGEEYQFEVEARQRPDAKSNSIQGKFRTAPSSDRSAPIRFIVTTCQAIRSIDDGPAGHLAYREMLAFDPHFLVHTGDIVYYDKVPFAKSVDQARSKWHLMFSYGHNRTFHRNVTSYFMKDDHDTLKNDCWPGQQYGELTFEEGLAIFRQQVCMGDSTFRTVRWGKDVQIWMTENRDFRSPNSMADGPQKTILGDAQKAWLKDSIADSDATFRFLISPGPLVGPDKKGKNDNHSNKGFAFEGQELRDFVASQPNTYVIVGDRHWQYCSQDPQTGVVELGCGPINDQHSFGGNPGKDQVYHRYFSAKGGFLGLNVEGSKATATWYGSGGKSPTPYTALHSETFLAQPR